MEVDILSTIKSFNISNDELVLKLEFITPEILDFLEQNKSDRILKWKIKYIAKKSWTTALRKCWYGSLKLIMIADEQDKNELNGRSLEEFDEDMRLSLFPIDENKNPPKPKRMKQLDEETGKRIIEKLHSRYSYMTVHGRPIDFSNLKGL